MDGNGVLTVKMAVWMTLIKLVKRKNRHTKNLEKLLCGKEKEHTHLLYVCVCVKEIGSKADKINCVKANR